MGNQNIHSYKYWKLKIKNTMKINFKSHSTKLLSLMIILTAVFACENDPNDFEEASYPKNPEVFIDDFSPGLDYASFGGAVPDAFEVDTEVTYNNSRASMRFDVPSVNNPEGAYAGGMFFTAVGRDLSGYDALTFWAKATQAGTLDVVGFGIAPAPYENKYQTSINGLAISTAWKKYIIPIPDASKLKMERGMFYISEGPENGNGYTFWIDEVKFEKLGTINPQQPQIFNGQNLVETSFVGVTSNVEGLVCSFNMPNGINQVVNLGTPAYFEFTSSNTSVATVSELGVINTVGIGTTIITAKLAGVDALGSLTINSSGTYVHAPEPMHTEANVISIYTDKYPNVPVNYYNGYWAPYQTTQSADFTVNGDNVLNYTNFNFVGIEFSTPTVNASEMSHLHIDLFIPGTLPTGANFQVKLYDFGANGVYDDNAGDDSSFNLTFAAPPIVTQNWVSLNIPLANFTGLVSRAHLGQLIFEGTGITNFYADNIYFYDDGTIMPVVPTTAAPTPTYPAANVTSIFSNAYTNLAGTDFTPNWGQTTVATQVSIAGNNTLRYTSFNYQGIALNGSVDVSSRNFLHLDYYSVNATSLRVFLISPGPVETPYVLTVPTTGGWNSIDIPLSSFAPVNLSNLIQLKFDNSGNGNNNGEIYLDNIYFRN